MATDKMKWACLLWDCCRIEEYLALLEAFEEEVRKDAEKERSRVEVRPEAEANEGQLDLFANREEA